MWTITKAAIKKTDDQVEPCKPWNRCKLLLLFVATVSDKDIQDIASQAELNYNHLDNLFGKLNIQHHEIERERRNANTTDYQIQAKCVLHSWRQNNGNCATRRSIIEALHDSNYIKAAEILIEKWRKGRPIRMCD